MGGAKHHQLHYNSLGLKPPIETFVCPNHIDDYAIKRHIVFNGRKGRCNYCKREKAKVVKFEFLMICISSGVNYLYDDAGNSMFYASEEGGYHGANTFDSQELIRDEVGLMVDNYELQKDIENAFDDSITWCERDPYGDREHESLYYDWSKFKDLVKHRTRYYFNNPGTVYEILNDVGRKVDSLNLFKSVPVGSKLFRCRQHDTKEIIKSASQMASPPLKYAIYSNRMSPAGISMFYCAFNRETALKETIDVRDLSKSSITVAQFQNKEELFLLDLTKLPKTPSIFDEDKRKDYSSIIFLGSFISDLSKDIKRDGKEHIEYIPTQIVTEYFRYAYEEMTKIAIDGIIYPSSKNKGKSACVLFMDHNESVERLDFKSTSISTKDVSSIPVPLEEQEPLNFFQF
jgi:hypothetical protein